MSQLRPHVHRERHLQALSAVWDLATPLTDDYEAGAEQGEEEGQGEGPGGSPVLKRTMVIEEAHHIARRAIEITLVGGFDQVSSFIALLTMLVSLAQPPCSAVPLIFGHYLISAGLYLPCRKKQLERRSNNLK